MIERYEIRLAGEGGQGLILSGLLLAAAVAVFDERNAVQTQSYTPLVRGAPSRSEIVISDGEIDFPEVVSADLLVALSQGAFQDFSGQVRPDGRILVDSDLVSLEGVEPLAPTLGLPFTRLARERVGKSLAASTVALGALAELTGVVRLSSLEEAVRMRAPHGTEELNLRALKVGAEAARELSAVAQPSA